MRPIVRRALVVALLASAVAGGLALFTNGIGESIDDGYLLAVAGVLLLALFRTTRLLSTRAWAPSQLDQALARMQPREQAPAELALERDVSLSVANAFHYHVRLRPVLRGIAAHRLRSRYGVELDREPARARELVPAQAWEVVDPDRPPPRDRMAAGPDVRSIAGVVDELERV
jgi:hypothetical protein